MTEAERAEYRKLIEEKAEAYTMKDIARDFPQIFRANGTIKRPSLKRKYSLRDGMKQLTTINNQIVSLTDLQETPEFCFFTRSGLVKIQGAAAEYICKQPDDIFIDLIEAGWDFRIC